MAIASNIKQNLETALTNGTFDPVFIDEVTAATEYDFLLKVLDELGHDVSVKKGLLNNQKITSGALSWVVNLRQTIITDNVFRALSSGIEVINSLKVV